MTDPVEADDTDRLLAAICAVWDRPYNEARRTALRAAFHGKLQTPGLTRLLEWATSGKAPDKMPTISGLWDAYHSLRSRASAYQAPAAPSAPRMDGWGIQANFHLMAVCIRGVTKGLKLTDAETAVLVAYKNAWATDMREAATESYPDLPAGHVPVEYQQRTWRDTMARAWADIEALRATATAA